jgi:hypothetical protein
MTQEEIIEEYKRLFADQTVEPDDPRMEALRQQMTGATINAILRFHGDQIAAKLKEILSGIVAPVVDPDKVN